MLKKVGVLAVIAAAVAVVVATTLGTTASAKVAAKSALCKKAGLGYGGPLSGGAAFLGDDQSNWEKLFIKNWNAGKKIPGVPKLHRVKLALSLEGDSTLNAQKAGTVARQMVANNKILGMVGFAGSNENLGGGPTLDAASLAYVSGSATLDTLATGAKGQKPLKFFYRVVPPNAVQAKTLPFLISHLGLKKNDKVMVVDDGEAYGIGLADDGQAIFKAHHLNVNRKSVKETDQSSAAEFAAAIQPVAAQAKALGVKLVYAPTQDAGDSQVFAQDLKTDGYTGAIMATDGSVSPDFHFAGAYVSFFGPNISAINKTYLKRYKAAYGAKSASDPFGAPSFVAAEMLGVAISKACSAAHGHLSSNIKTARGAVAAKLAKTKLKSTILGYPMAFNNPADAFHGPSSGATLFQIKSNGKYNQLYATH
jgi:ABC-type branched-subunit amino acid transport system substrate-binding protein